MLWTNALRLAGLALLCAICAAPVSSPASAQQSAPVQTPAPETPAEPAQPEAPTVVPIEVPERPALVARGKAKWDDGFKAITDAFVTLRAEAEKELGLRSADRQDHGGRQCGQGGDEGSA